jgi:chaperonin GroES
MIKSTHHERVLTLPGEATGLLSISIFFNPKGVAMNLRPLNDRVVVKRMEEEQKTAGGIIIPDTAKEKPIQGEVIAAGNGKTMEDGSKRALDVKKGDRVLFGKYAGTEITVEGQEVLIMREDDILAIIE